jgi:hypothetical protein
VKDGVRHQLGDDELCVVDCRYASPIGAATLNETPCLANRLEPGLEIRRSRPVAVATEVAQEVDQVANIPFLADEGGDTWEVLSMFRSDRSRVDDYLGVRSSSPKLGDHFTPGKIRQTEIQDDHVRSAFRGQGDGCIAIGRLGYHFEATAQPQRLRYRGTNICYVVD